MSVSLLFCSMSAFLSLRIPAQSILPDARQHVWSSKSCDSSVESKSKIKTVIIGNFFQGGTSGPFTFLLFYSHHSHVVLWFQRDLQHLRPVHHPLHAGCGDSLPGDAVDLVKGVWFQELFVRRADVDLEPQLCCPFVPMKLVKSNQMLEMCDLH